MHASVVSLDNDASLHTLGISFFIYSINMIDNSIYERYSFIFKPHYTATRE